MKKQIRYLFSILNFLYDHTEGFLLVTFTVLLVIDVFLGIMARYVHFEVVFATELGKYLFIWLCAVGISAAARENQHVRIHFVARRLPVDPKISWIVSQTIFLLFSIFFLIWGTRLTLMHINMKKLVVGFNFPMYVFTAALPVGFGLTALRLLRNILFTLKAGPGTDPWENPLMNEIIEPDND